MPQVGWLGLPRFTSPSAHGIVAGGVPVSLAEASDRPVYCTLNQHRLANPANSWGDVSFVLNRSGAVGMVRQSRHYFLYYIIWTIFTRFLGAGWWQQ